MSGMKGTTIMLKNHHGRIAKASYVKLNAWQICAIELALKNAISQRIIDDFSGEKLRALIDNAKIIKVSK